MAELCQKQDRWISTTVTIHIKTTAATYLGVLGVALFVGGLPETRGCSDISVECRDWTDGYRIISNTSATTYLGVLGVALYVGGLPETRGCSDISVECRDWTDGCYIISPL